MADRHDSERLWGFCDGQFDICDSRVDFATENFHRWGGGVTSHIMIICKCLILEIIGKKNLPFTIFRGRVFSVAKATLELQMSVCPSVCPSVCHRNPPASKNCSYRPSSLSTTGLLSRLLSLLACKLSCLFIARMVYKDRTFQIELRWK